MIGAIGEAAQPTVQFASAQAKAAFEDPLEYFIRITRKLGSGLLVAGLGMGVGAYYLKAASVSGMNNEQNTLGDLASIFSNIRTPTFQPAAAGTAPISASVAGIQNFASDAWADIQAAASDVSQAGAAMGTLLEDVATGIVDIAKVILGFTTHFPDILWNGMVWGIGGAVADVLTWAFPWFIIAGGALVIASTVAYIARYWWDHNFYRWWARIELAINAKEASKWNRYDREHHVRRKLNEVFSQKSTEGLIHTANLNPRFVAAESRTFKPKAERPSAPPPKPPEPKPPSEKPKREPKAKEEPPDGKPPEVPPTETKPEPPKGKPLPVGTPTEEVERQLGEPDAAEPTADEIREMELNRIKSMPPEDMAADNRAKLDAVRSAADASDIVDEKTKVIKEAQAMRREARVMEEDALSKPKFSTKRHSGALEGMDREAMLEADEAAERVE